ncbi:ABC transporter-like protein [Cryptosporidium canis]|uniref:ABC transporter-like protein n=1 Tax=Cryptosporidium canis TaxID=195482 RepID=A0ABQ8P3P4_9CRYT|nr:ABC transporter-like protein [Cryptosporidium canis]
MGFGSYLGRIWSILSFGFINKYLLSRRRPRITSIDDLPELYESDKLDYWVERLSQALEDEEERSMYGNRRFQIYRPLIKTLWRPTLGALTLRLGFDVLALLSSIFLSHFSMSSSTSNAILSSLFMFFTVLFKSFFDCYSRMIVSRLCVRIEGSLIWVALDRVVRHKEMYPELPLSTVYMMESSKKPSSCRKSLLLRQHEVKFSSSNAASESSNIFNLIIGDAAAIEIFFGVLVDFLLLPIRLLMSWYVLSRVLGSSSALPTILSFCIILGLSFLFEIFGALNKEPFMINRDKRIDRCHEVLSDIRSIRLTGLEDVAISRVTKSREKELFWNRRRFIYSRIAAFADYHLKAYSQYILFILSTYYLFYHSNGEGRSNFIHTGASALQILMQLSSKIRSLPTNIIEGIISIQRYESFVVKHPIERRKHSDCTQRSGKASHHYYTDDRPNRDAKDSVCNDHLFESSAKSCMYGSDHQKSNAESAPLLSLTGNLSLHSNADSRLQTLDQTTSKPDLMVSIKDGAFTWNNDSFSNSTLKNINISLGLRECIFLVGEPGCGKSSLIKAILHEIRPLASSAYVRPRETNSVISYSPQLPWIPSGSIRSAILLGREWDRNKYELVVDCCQLEDDFLSWQRGDLRTVDEGGFSLSGGQRARVSLARALYSLPIRFSSSNKNDFFVDTENPKEFESLLYLLDEVFISVDPKVGFHIFNRLFGPNGLLLGVSSVITITVDSLHHYMANVHYLHQKSRDPEHLLDSSSPDDFDFDGFHFKVCVLNDGKVEWSGTYSDYLKETSQTLVNQELIADDQIPRLLNFKSLQITSIDLHDESNNTDIQFTELLNSGDGGSSKNQGSYMNSRFSSYRWYFRLLGQKWMTTFILGCVLKVVIDKVLELLYVNNSEHAQRSEKEVLKFCFSATISVLIESILSLIVYIGEAIGGIEAARKSHEIFLYKIVYAPFWFFDVNSVGKILSRFSSDMLAIDNCTIRRITAVILPLISLLFNISYVSFIVPLTLPFEIIVIFFIIRYIGVRLLLTYRDAQRCALLALSPLCSIFSECLSGGSIIRAFGTEKYYFNKCGSFVEKLQRARFLQHCACQWAGLRMQLLTAPLTLIVSTIGIIFPSYKLILALPLTYTISFAENINEIIFRLISLEKDMCSVGHIYEYISLLDEDSKDHPQMILQDSAIPDTRQGILISDLEVRYRRPNYRLNDKRARKENKDEEKAMISGSKAKCSLSSDSSACLDEMYFSPTLKNINEFAGPNDHIGIVGRSGSGKSTFIMALFGFVPTTRGHVYLDGVPINNIPASTKRKIVGVLPQVPLILKGWTVRDFLDPEGQRSSEDLWEALRICCLSGTIRSLPGGKMLDTVLVPDLDISSSNEGKIIYSKGSNKRSVGGHEASTGQIRSGSYRGECQESITNLVARYLSDSQLRYLSLARLVVNARDYRLILVDEPPPDTFEEHTSEKCYVPVHELLRTYFPHCTVFVVAHHAASLQNCNSIWVLGNGTIETVIHPKGVVSQKYLAGLLCNG